MPPVYRSFREFWPFYLEEHRQPMTRALHFIGTTSVVGIVVGGLLVGKARWLWAAPVLGYGFAWTSHFFVEKNRPATFKYPLWSLMADFRMWGAMITGRMDAVTKPAREGK